MYQIKRERESPGTGRNLGMGIFQWGKCRVEKKFSERERGRKKEKDYERTKEHEKEYDRDRIRDRKDMRGRTRKKVRELMNQKFFC